MVATLTDRIGTETESIQDKMQIMQLSKQIGNAFAGEYMTNLHYCYYNGSNVAPGMAEIGFKINSIFDPDLDNISGNFQPIGRDTWASIYNYYKVVHTKVWVQVGTTQTVGNTDSLDHGANAYPMLIGGMIDLTAAGPSTQNNWLNSAELGRTNRQQIFSPVSHLSGIIGEPKSTTFEMQWDPTLLESAILDQSTKDTWTPVGADPYNLEYFTILLSNPSTGVNNRGIWYRIHLEYTVSFKQVNRTILSTLN